MIRPVKAKSRKNPASKGKTSKWSGQWRQDLEIIFYERIIVLNHVLSELLNNQSTVYWKIIILNMQKFHPLELDASFADDTSISFSASSSNQHDTSSRWFSNWCDDLINIWENAKIFYFKNKKISHSSNCGTRMKQNRSDRRE